MIIIIDNYDSFTFNLYQQLRVLAKGRRCEIEVIRNDALPGRRILDLATWGVIFSPGPGGPCDTGVCREIMMLRQPELPTLGICLGHQLIACHFGADVGKAVHPLHGRASVISHDGSGLFRGAQQSFSAARYHSLAVRKDSVRPPLSVCAWSGDGEIMGLNVERHSAWGFQFHPESFLTEAGGILITNFLNACEKYADSSRSDIRAAAD